MQHFYPPDFDRDMGCTASDWLGWLPQAIGEHPWTCQTGAAAVRIGAGTLSLQWQTAAPRVIGQISIPVLQVSFRFAAVDEATRHAFMKRFDLYMQRGGG